MSDPRERALRRILVALDASRASLEAVSAAAALAGRIGAELEGLFVEDINLLRLAGLPFASELRLPSGAGRPLVRVDLEAELRALAAEARETLAQAAQPQRVVWSFRVARGHVTVEVLEAAGEADLLVLGRAARRMGPGAGETARTAAARSPVSVLVLSREGGLGGPMRVAYDGSPAAGRALDLASRIAEASGSLGLVVLAGSRGEAEQLAGQAQRRLGSPGPLPWRWAGGESWEDLLRVAGEPGGVLVVGVDTALLSENSLERLLDEAACPVLLVR